jgi:hypothetical protein
VCRAAGDECASIEKAFAVVRREDDIAQPVEHKAGARTAFGILRQDATTLVAATERRETMTVSHQKK